MLGYYIKSLNHNLWNDKQLSSEWIAWRIILGNIRYYNGYIFGACNSEAYVNFIYVVRIPIAIKYCLT